MAIKREDIIQAANTITSTGGTVSAKEVRAILGSGSYSTIGPVVKEFIARQAPTGTHTFSVEATPKLITDALAAAAHKIWLLANNLAISQLATEKTIMANEHSSLQYALTDCSETADLIASELDNAQAEILRLSEAEASAAITYEASLSEHVSVARQAESRATASEAIIAAHVTQISDLQSIVGQLRSDQETLINRAASAEGVASAQSSQITDFRGIIDQLRGELSIQSNDIWGRIETVKNDSLQHISYLEGELVRVNYQNTELVKVLTQAPTE